MFFIQIINLLIRFTLILSETYIKNESVFYLPDYFGKIDRYFVYPAMREINTEHGKFNLTFKRRDCLVNCFDYIVYNISNKITNASFEGIDPKEILKRDKPNEEIVFYQMIPFSSHSKCKYFPTCSNYAKEAITKYGAFKGTLLSIKRICKCNPFSKGGIDFVP